MAKPIKNIPEFDRPREKLKAKGVKALSNKELLMVILGRGMKGRDVSVLAKDILKEVEKEKIYEWINKAQPIDLKNKYVKGFSLKEYRKHNKMETSEEVILKNFNAKEAFFDEDIDFSHATFEGNVCFQGSFFEKRAYFCSVNFGDGDVNFGRTIFGGGCVNFMLSTFGKGKVIFWQADFGDGLVDFKSANFGGEEVDFSLTNFGDGNVNFVGTNFGNGVVTFERAIFGVGDVVFGGAIFGDKNVNFSFTTFGSGDIIFSEATFGDGDVNFEDAIFGEGTAVFDYLKVKGDWNMSAVKADIIDFSRSIIHGTLNFTEAKINILALIDTQLTGKIFTSSRELRLGRGLKQKKDAINVQHTSHREKRDQFRLLKENFRNLGQYDDEDNAYVQFMRHKIRVEREIEQEDSFWTRVQKRIFFSLKWFFYEKVGLFGTSPLRIALSMFVIIAFFAILYLPFSKNVRTPAPFFHSVITFLTIGYGTEFMAFNSFWFKLFSGIEGFAGLFLMSYFTIAFVRKVLR